MGQQRGQGSRAARGHRAGPAGRPGGSGLARAAVIAAAAGVLAGCGASAGSAGSASGSTSHPAAAATGAASPSAGATAAATASAAAFTPIMEPFDPGHPAEAKTAPASCGGQSSTLAIEQCYQARTENADAAIDALQQARYQAGPATQKTAITADDGAWLAARQPVCAKAYHTGGSIDGINVAACLLAESTARLAALQGSTPPEAALKATDSTKLSDLSWYTTPEGSRIAMIQTQGDATGGSVVAWVIIAGANGFVVNPGQFAYRDGSFTDQGKVEPPSPAGHRVAPGAEYQFGIDYSRLRADPGHGKGGWVYAPGSPVAIWR